MIAKSIDIWRSAEATRAEEPCHSLMHWTLEITSLSRLSCERLAARLAVHDKRGNSSRLGLAICQTVAVILGNVWLTSVRTRSGTRGQAKTLAGCACTNSLAALTTTLILILIIIAALGILCVGTLRHDLERVLSRVPSRPLPLLEGPLAAAPRLYLLSLDLGRSN
jgi:hypothetical protein